MSNKPALIAYTVRDYKDNDGNDKNDNGNDIDDDAVQND